MTGTTITERPDCPYISVIVPAYNESDNVVPFLAQLTDQLKCLPIRYEIIVVDDGSTDNTVQLLHQSGQTTDFKLIQLSRNFGKEAALTAGLDHAQGNAVIMIDADFQHPVEMIPEFLRFWRAGYDMVYGLRTDRKGESLRKRWLTEFFYRLLSRTSTTTIVPDAGDFRLLDRCAVEALKSLPERSRFMKGLYSWIGFKSIGIPFKVVQRQAGHSKFSIHKLSKLAFNALISFSELPLHIWALVGALIALVSIFYALWVITETLIYGINVPGWATMTVGMFFLGGIQLLSIGILGEYISRIFIEVKGRPNYIVAKTSDFHDGKVAAIS